MVEIVLRLQQDNGSTEEDWFELEPHVQAIAAGYGTRDIDTLWAGTAISAALQGALCARGIIRVSRGMRLHRFGEAGHDGTGK